MAGKEARRVREFQEAYKQEFGQKISLTESRAMRPQLVELYRCVARALPTDPTASKKRDAHDE